MSLLVVSHVDRIHFYLSPKSYSLVVISKFYVYSGVVVMHTRQELHTLLVGIDLTI